MVVMVMTGATLLQRQRQQELSSFLPSLSHSLLVSRHSAVEGEVREEEVEREGVESNIPLPSSRPLMPSHSILISLSLPLSLLLQPSLPSLRERLFIGFPRCHVSPSVCRSAAAVARCRRAIHAVLYGQHSSLTRGPQSWWERGKWCHSRVRDRETQQE